MSVDAFIKTYNGPAVLPIYGALLRLCEWRDRNGAGRHADLQRDGHDSAGGWGCPVTPGGLTSSNYDITFVAGSVTINKAALSITAVSQTKIYGTALAFDQSTPSADFTIAGLVSGDSVTGVTLMSTGAGALATRRWIAVSDRRRQCDRRGTRELQHQLCERVPDRRSTRRTCFLHRSDDVRHIRQQRTTAQVTLTASVADPDGSVSLGTAGTPLACQMAFKGAIVAKAFTRVGQVHRQEASELPTDPVEGTMDIAIRTR